MPIESGGRGDDGGDIDPVLLKGDPDPVSLYGDPDLMLPYAEERQRVRPPARPDPIDLPLRALRDYLTKRRAAKERPPPDRHPGSGRGIGW